MDQEDLQTVISDDDTPILETGSLDEEIVDLEEDSSPSDLP